MRSLRTAFTLIEMLIAISIFSIMILYLYNTYASLNISNDNLKGEVQQIQKIHRIKKAVFLDFTLALFNPKGIVHVNNRGKMEDFVFFQTTHSLHRRINPYVTYIVKNKKLYRLESLKKFDSFELPSDAEFDVDELGDIKSFRVYSATKTMQSYLIAIDFTFMKNVLLKVEPLNQY